MVERHSILIVESTFRVVGKRGVVPSQSRSPNASGPKSSRRTGAKREVAQKTTIGKARR